MTSLPSVQTVLIVSNKTKRVTVIARKGKGWEETEFRSSEVALSTAPSLSLDVDSLYPALAGM